MIEWRSIPVNLNYEASTEGTVRSLHDVTKLRILKTWKNWNGYHLVGLGQKAYAVHRIVALTFHGPCPDGLECSHLDGNKNNNRADNLKYVTRKENHAHKKLHGTAQVGEKGGRAKLKNNDVYEIRRLANKVTQRSLAKRFNVSESVISRIVLKKTWKHLLTDMT